MEPIKGGWLQSVIGLAKEWGKAVSETTWGEAREFRTDDELKEARAAEIKARRKLLSSLLGREPSEQEMKDFDVL